MESKGAALLNYQNKTIRDKYLISDTELNEIPLLKKIYHYLVLVHFDENPPSPEDYFTYDNIKNILDTLHSCSETNPDDFSSSKFKNAFNQGKYEVGSYVSSFGHVKKVFRSSVLTSLFNKAERGLLVKDNFTVGEINSLKFLFYEIANKVFGTEDIDMSFIDNVFLSRHNNYNYIDDINDFNLEGINNPEGQNNQRSTPILKPEIQLSILNSLFCNLGSRAITRKHNLINYVNPLDSYILSEQNYLSNTKGGKKRTNKKCKKPFGKKQTKKHKKC